MVMVMQCTNARHAGEKCREVLVTTEGNGNLLLANLIVQVKPHI
jgi:hypothetical protein